MLNVRERRAAQRLAEIRDLVGGYGLTRTSELLDVHPSTVTRWQEGTAKAPGSALVALRAAVRGQVPGMETTAWKGWRFGRDGSLYPPGYSRGYSAGQILAMHYEHQLLAHLKRQVAELEEKLARALELGHTAANDPLISRSGR
jgi:DNA-binding transcriptional regulator YdaS (Cro superfamily)